MDSNDNEPLQSMTQSRILFEEVVIDNEPTEEEVIERAHQLQIDDLILARQSLTKQLQTQWRPYINRYGDVYYINLKQKRAYIDHPVDMDTKLLYAKRYKKPLPKFRSYELEEVVGSILLIEEEIARWRQREFSFTKESIPTKLNIVYEESDESQTDLDNQSQLSQQNSKVQSVQSSRFDRGNDEGYLLQQEKSTEKGRLKVDHKEVIIMQTVKNKNKLKDQQQSEDEEYIENLQHSNRGDRDQKKSQMGQRKIQIQSNIYEPKPKLNQIQTKTTTSHNMHMPNQFNRRENKKHKRFPTLEEESQDQQHQQKINDQSQLQPLTLTPQYEALLLLYEKQLTSKHSQQLQTYTKKKQQNYQQKENLIKQSQGQKQQQYKLILITDFQKETDSKNQTQFQKDLNNLKNNLNDKLHAYQTQLQKEYQITSKLIESQQQKKSFIQTLQHKLQNKINFKKYLAIQQLQQNIIQNHCKNPIESLSTQELEKFSFNLKMLIKQKIDKILSQKGVYHPVKNEVLFPGTLSNFYESMVRKQLQNIDNLLVENELSNQVRKKKRRATIFEGRKETSKEQTLKDYRDGNNKENDMTWMNKLQKERRTGSKIEAIQSAIRKADEENMRFHQRKSLIFGGRKQPIKYEEKQTSIVNGGKQVNRFQIETFDQNYKKSELIWENKGIERQVWSKQGTQIIKDRKSLYLRMMRRIL